MPGYPEGSEAAEDQSKDESPHRRMAAAGQGHRAVGPALGRESVRESVRDRHPLLDPRLQQLIDRPRGRRAVERIEVNSRHTLLD